MASTNQITGMRGVYLVAAELSRLGFIVSPTSRSAAGADLLVTDQNCQNAWSVQVKTNKALTNFWLVGPHARKRKSKSHVYVFVNINGELRPEYHVVGSEQVAENTIFEKSSTGSEWYSFMRPVHSSSEGWELFGDPCPAGTAQEQMEQTLS